MRYTLILVGVLVLIVGGILVFSSGSRESASAPAEDARSSAPSTQGENTQGENLPALTLKDYNGVDVSLTNFSGKPAIVNSWAAWCPFCKQELPDFAALQKEFPNITVIAIDRAEPLGTAKRYSDELGVTGKLTLLLDPLDSFYKAIGGFTMPETLFVDKDGNVVFHKRGPLTLDEMRQKVSEFKLGQ